MAVEPPPDNLPLAEVMRAANGLVSAGLIEDWPLGGARGNLLRRTVHHL
jgi:hypothetical protein